MTHSQPGVVSLLSYHPSLVSCQAGREREQIIMCQLQSVSQPGGGGWEAGWEHLFSSLSRLTGSSGQEAAGGI